MERAKNGDTVKVHYTGSMPDGQVFDTSREREPLQMTIGAGEIVPGFEEAVVDMGVGETKTVDLAPEEAFGQRNEEMVAVVERSQIPENIEVEPGQMLTVRTEDGQTFDVTVTDVSGDAVTVDGNHPLAGQDLRFEIELLEIV
jgi:peptidylprolyl isomerase